MRACFICTAQFYFVPLQPKFQTHNVMIDLKNAKLEDFELIEAPKLDRSKKVRCTFFRVKPGSYKPNYKNRRIADMLKELFHEYFQIGV